jgi:predicted glycoside hydrolase/deacetylase ChbG (UPF0249 family)
MKVIVHADDLGISPGVTDRIIHTHRNGAVRRTSIVANGQAFDRAVKGLRENPGLIWSVHLNLVEGRCLADPRELSLLVDQRGWFKRDFFGLALLPVLTPWCRADLRRQIRLELGAQIGRVAQALGPAGNRPAGNRPASIRVDSHRYVHLLPLVFSVLMEQADSWGIREMRVVSEPLFTARRGPAGLIGLISPNLLKWLVLRMLTRRCRGELERRGIGYPRRSLGVLCSGRMTAGVVDRGVQRILRHPPVEDGELEILFHPGPADPEDRSCWREKPRQSRFYFSSLRAAETEALLSPELRTAVENGPLRKTADRSERFGSQGIENERFHSEGS